MSDIILQHFTGTLRPLDELSIENIKAYAKRINVDYQFVEGQVFRRHLTPPCQKAFILNEKWDDYENVLMLDIDMFVTKDLQENVFDFEGVGFFGETQKRLKNQLIANGRIMSSDGYWSGAFYKLNKSQRIRLRNAIPSNDSWMNLYNRPYHFEDEGIISELFSITRTPWKNMEPRWQQDSYLPPSSPGMVHVRTKITPKGPKREKIENYRALVEEGIL